MTVKLPTLNLNTTGIQPVEIYLDDPQVRRFASLKPGDTLHCTRGMLWVTQENDLKDHVVRQGEQFIVSQRGVVVVEGMQDAALRLVSCVRRN
jgi:hypothetical protein